ncbi:glycosyltransferase family 39 protein [Bacteroides nordii]|uniref:glycosyltransferase family 39 protein n=1 Tax=Bacteroides nordii TaxID=291645 RepID=UPI001897C3DD|nr:glycosyltransferase family 39 protein [Bacteroides nordii]
MKKKVDITALLLLIILSIICFISVTSWSLWVDEAITAEMYSVDGFSELISQFQTRLGSEVQMPGWIVFMWGWCKLFGNSEYALRASNWLFIGLFLLYGYRLIAYGKITIKERIIIQIILCISICNPFILYNMNEARCNISIFSFSFITILSLWYFLKTENRKDWYICLISFILGYFFNMLVGFLIFSLLFIIWKKNEWRKISKQGIKSFFIIIVLFIVLTLYYLITIFLADKGGQIERPGIGNIGYSLYEFIGFGGLGPNKNMIRESDDKKVLLLQYIIYMFPLIICYSIIFVSVFRKKKKEWILNVFFISFLLCFVIFYVVACVIQFRFWGRHLIFIYPLWLIFMGYTLYLFSLNRNMLYKIVLVVYIFFIFSSSYRILFNNNYKKENIKDIVQQCKKLRLPGEIIYWSEAEDTSLYYNLNDTLVKNGLPIISTDSGMLVWFKRLKWLQEDKYQDFIHLYLPVTIYENKDFVIYRFKGAGHK